MSASAAARRRADSMNTRLARTPASSARARRRAALRGGRNPANRKRSVGSPESTSAARTADGPGRTVTGTSSAMQALTSR